MRVETKDVGFVWVQVRCFHQAHWAVLSTFPPVRQPVRRKGGTLLAWLALMCAYLDKKGVTPTYIPCLRNRTTQGLFVQGKTRMPCCLYFKVNGVSEGRL